METKIVESQYGLVVSSRVIAEQLGKRHSDVLEALAKILTDGNFRSLIIPSEYKDKKGELRKEYLLTKDGFTLYMFNIRGYNDFKIAYIQKFNEMERVLTKTEVTLKNDWALKRIDDRVNQAEYLEELILELTKKLNSIYSEIENVARIKKECSFHFFDEFKEKESYDASKEKLPKLVID